MWCYAFSHEEAVRCFRRAAGHDPGCAMAWWGIGYAAGPYYNKPWSKFDPADLAATLGEVRTATREALKRIGNASPVERTLVEALARRCPSSGPAEAGDFDRWNDDYADAMREVYRAFPGDPDVCALFAEALMNRTPWALWDLGTGEPAEGADTLEALAALEEGIGAREAAGEPDHPGLLHMYLHVLEMSPHPERALRAADRLRDLVPDAGHLRHNAHPHRRPVRGLPRDGGVERPRRRRRSEVLRARGPPALVRALLRAQLPLHALRGDAAGPSPVRDGRDGGPAGGRSRIGAPHGKPADGGLAGRLRGDAGARADPLRKWREILAMALPEDPILYCTTTAMLHYARGLAHAVLEDVPAAEVERSRFEAAVDRVPATRIVFNNTCLDILAIAARMLHGEVSYRAGDHETAFEHLRAAVRLADALPYDEPWGWMQPPRHALGALLLEQGRVEEAETVYRPTSGSAATPRPSADHREAMRTLVEMASGSAAAMPRSGPAGIPTTSGACTAFTNASCARANRPRRRWWPRGSPWRWRGRTCRSGPRACAGAGARRIHQTHTEGEQFVFVPDESVDLRVAQVEHLPKSIRADELAEAVHIVAAHVEELEAARRRVPTVGPLDRFLKTTSRHARFISS